MTRIHTTGQDNWRYRQPTYQPTGLTREQIAPLHTDDTRTPGLIRLLIAVFLVVVIGANVFP